jgi:HNH endonuclease
MSIAISINHEPWTDADRRRFEQFVIKTSDGCWIWAAGLNGKGVPYYWTGQGGKVIAAHRFAYAAYIGSIPEGAVVAHHSGVSLCVCPEHLVLMSKSAYLKQCPTSPASMTHCKRGHEFSEENTRVDNRGLRICKTCQRDYLARRKAQAKAELIKTGAFD